MISWHATGRLALDRDGILWRWAADTWHRLGPIDDEDLPIPRRLERERDEMLSLWRDAVCDRDEQMQPLR